MNELHLKNEQLIFQSRKRGKDVMIKVLAITFWLSNNVLCALDLHWSDVLPLAGFLAIVAKPSRALRESCIFPQIFIFTGKPLQRHHKLTHSANLHRSNELAVAVDSNHKGYRQIMCCIARSCRCCRQRCRCCVRVSSVSAPVLLVLLAGLRLLLLLAPLFLLQVLLLLLFLLLLLPVVSPQR